jgi:hypothetical protein
MKDGNLGEGPRETALLHLDLELWPPGQREDKCLLLRSPDCGTLSWQPHQTDTLGDLLCDLATVLLFFPFKDNLKNKA